MTDFYSALEHNRLYIPFVILGLSLLGSSHCIAMCSPLCFGFTKSFPTAMRYHLARLLSYLILGSAVFFFKERVSELPYIKELSTWNSLILFSLLILFGINILRGKQTSSPKWATKSLISASNFMNKRGLLGPSSIGLLNGFIPCGWLYSFLLLIPFSSSFIESTIWIVFFWLPNAILLSITALGIRCIPIKKNKLIAKSFAVLLIVFSSYKIVYTLNNSSAFKPSTTSDSAACH